MSSKETAPLTVDEVLQKEAQTATRVGGIANLVPALPLHDHVPHELEALGGGNRAPEFVTRPYRRCR